MVRFCKDVETRGQAVTLPILSNFCSALDDSIKSLLICVQGYVDFGRFDPLSYFVSSSEKFDFVQVRTSSFSHSFFNIITSCCIE